ncbi:MAG TPA: hypothetical protein VEW48_18700 [Thermoanaerobaculia bacterium]|nr:hypothetical protein [Thermoanaerobaculia bacterium]
MTKGIQTLMADQQSPRAGGAAFLQRVEALKQRYDGGVSDFEPDRLEFVPADPFAGVRTRRERVAGGDRSS